MSIENSTMVNYRDGCLFESRNLPENFQILINQQLDITTAKATYRCFSSFVFINLDLRRRRSTTKKKLVVGKASAVIHFAHKKCTADYSAKD